MIHVSLLGLSCVVRGILLAYSIHYIWRK
jgi:hypothetical protein